MNAGLTGSIFTSGLLSFNPKGKTRIDQSLHYESFKITPYSFKICSTNLSQFWFSVRYIINRTQAIKSSSLILYGNNKILIYTETNEIIDINCVNCYQLQRC